jgi:hypothetical protein
MIILWNKNKLIKMMLITIEVTVNFIPDNLVHVNRLEAMFCVSNSEHRPENWRATVSLPQTVKAFFQLV